MKRRYADGDLVFEEGMEVPANVEDMKSATGPLTAAQRLGKMVIGGAKDLASEEKKRFSRMPMEPVGKGKEVGVRKAAKKTEVYEKKFSSGGYTKAADGICKRGKTRGKMV